MQRLPHHPIAFLLSLSALLFTALPALAETVDSGATRALDAPSNVAGPGIAGQVLGATAPLMAATVYAYDLAESKIHRVSTDRNGRFLFRSIPAGLYKVIAHKPGFVPGVLKITRITADMEQFLELRLDEMKADFGEPVDDYWKARSEVPTDVLRDIEMSEIAQAAAAEARRLSRLAALPARFQTSMAVHSGVHEMTAAGDSQVMGGKVDIEGRVGEMRLGLAGDFRQLEPSAYSATETGSALVGEASALSLQMANDRGMELQVSSRSNSLAGEGVPVDMQHYRINVSSDIGDHGRSSLTAGYTTESNFHRRGAGDPFAVPEASRSWHLAGSYETHLTERASLQTGIRYRELETASGPNALFGGAAEERFDVFGLSSQRLLPTMLVKYGIYASMVNGNMSLIPQGGVVVQLAPKWQASALASHKVDDGDAYDQPRSFLPVYFGETGGCDQNLQSCYQVTVSHLKSDEESLSIGAIHREYDEIEKLYFDEDFFNRFESLYLVPGDQLPELQFAISRRLSPNIHTRLESSLAQGGGGVFQAADRSTWENDVRYLVTSLDTQFQATATGVYLAFHHLDQNLESDSAAVSADEAFAVERLQVRLTQDLNFLRALAADWALNLNMELSRGSSPYVTTAEEDDIRKRLLGGIAVSF